MAIQLLTFGGLHVVSDQGELGGLLGQHSRAALFVYLAVERRVARESLIAFFWPESDAENARHALRQSLYQLRKAIGSEWIESRAHELVVTGDVRADAHELIEATDRGDFATAVDLYRGPFLDGVHLVDLKAWESWVDTRRARYARAFRKASRALIDEKHAAGDLTGVVAAAEQWAARDPSDDEAQHRLIESLAAVGERAEAIRQYEAYAKQLEPDGLQPLDETVRLVNRLRSDAAALPSPAAMASTGSPLLHQAESNSAASGLDVRQPVSSARPSRRRPVTIGVALTFVALVAALVWVTRMRRAPSPAAPGNAVAVLPFSVRGGENVQYLGNGMVNLLGAALDGAESLRPVDTRAVFATVEEAGRPASDSRLADRVAARLGAARYVLGDVVAAGGQIQIGAGVYDVGAGCASRFRWGRLAAMLAGCPTPEPVARAVVSGPADSVFALVDQLAARLLGGLRDSKADRLLRTAAMTTASLPAFKSYLEGEGLMRDGEFEKAADAYLSAIALDSTFALAYYRLGLAREWAPLPGEDSAAAAAARHGARLSSRDHALLEAFREWRSGDAADAERAYRSILSRYPDDVDAWFQLAEILFHHGPLFGRPIGESEGAWRRVRGYEPRNLFTITHLARIAVLDGRGAALDSLLAPFSPTELETDRRLAELVLLRAVLRGDTVTQRTLVDRVRRWEPFAVWRVAVFLTAFSPKLLEMSRVIDGLAVDLPAPAQRADLYWMRSMLDLAAGRPDSARASIARAVASEAAVAPEHRRRAFEDVTTWYAATLPLPYADSTLARVRRDAAARSAASGPGPVFENETGIGLPIRLEPVRQYTLGILASRLRDPAGATAAAATLRQFAAVGGADPLIRDLDRGLRARLAWQRGDAEGALRLLDSLESRNTQGDVAATPFVSRASERFLRGEVLASLGRSDEALRWFAALGDGSVTEIPLRAVSHLRQAEIYDRLGKRDDAARHRARAAEIWRNAVPEFRRRLEMAELTPR
jgi:DNA-binding SARP family transcriptional activator